MEKETHLYFDTYIGKQKPNSIKNREQQCPFCDVTNLEGILAKDESIVLVKNKYPTLLHTFQTVLIETETCEEDLASYSKEHLYKLIKFGVYHWLEMEKSGEFQSVLFFKNYGPLSGGTIHHAHMQIVGLRNVQYRDHISWEQFKGIVVQEEAGVEINTSTKPRMGFHEFNVILRDRKQINRMADYIQATVRFILYDFPFPCSSYNLFFYHIDNTIVAKVIPRFVTTPLFVGYSIPQVTNQVHIVADMMRQKYFETSSLDMNR